MKTRKRVVLIILIAVVSAAVFLAAAVAGILSKTIFIRHPELQGEPETGKWYRITPENAKSSDGSEWHGLLRKGTENKVVVYFFGGGVSINGYTSERGKEFFATTAQVQDFVASGGIGSDREENPFKDWSFHMPPVISTAAQENIIIWTEAKKRPSITTAITIIPHLWRLFARISASRKRFL